MSSDQGNKRAVTRLKTTCEKAKRTLSSCSQATVEIVCLFDGIDFVSDITRSRFEQLNTDFFDRTLRIVEETLRDAKIDRSQIDEIVLAGGSTRIPKIIELLQGFFNGKELNKKLDSDESVAYGATALAASLTGNITKGIQELLLYDVTPLSLGTDIVGGIMSIIIDKHTTIPTKQTQTYQTTVDNQTKIGVQVFEGERPMTKDNHFLGEFTISGLQPAPKGVCKIDVTMEIDADSILAVSAVEKNTKNENSKAITIEKGRLNGKEIEKMIKEARKFKQEDEMQRLKIASKNSLEFYAYKMKSTAADEYLKDKLQLSADDKMKISAKCDEVIDWLNVHTLAEREVYEQKQKEFESVCNPIRNML